MTEGRRKGRWRKSFDSRIGWVGIAYGLTILIYLLGSRLSVFDDHGFHASFWASWLQDICFFGIVGAAVFYLSLDPTRADFDTRLRYLFKLRKVPESLVNYNKQRIAELGFYLENPTFRIEVQGIPEPGGSDCFDICVYISAQVRNLGADLGHDTVTLPIHLTPADGIGAGKAPLQLLHLRRSDGGSEGLEDVKTSRDLFQPFSTLLTLSPLPDSPAKYELAYRQLVPKGHVMEIGFSRFCAALRVTMVNKAKFEVPLADLFEIEEGGLQPRRNLIQSAKSVPIEDVADEVELFTGDLAPGSRIQFRWDH
jgi:hypothetical protein